MICGKCGTPIEPTDKFCAGCGAPVIDNFVWGNGESTVVLDDLQNGGVLPFENRARKAEPQPPEADRPREQAQQPAPEQQSEQPQAPEVKQPEIKVTDHVSAGTAGGGRMDPTERHELVFLTREEAVNGCRKIIEVDGQNISLDIPPKVDVNSAIYIDGCGYADKTTGKKGRLKVQFMVD